MRLRRGETVPALKNPRHRLRVCVLVVVIICAVLAALSASAHLPMPSLTLRCGGADHHGADSLSRKASRQRFRPHVSIRSLAGGDGAEIVKDAFAAHGRQCYKAKGEDARNASSMTSATSMFRPQR